METSRGVDERICYGGRWDGGREMGAGCVGTFRTIGRVEDEVGEGMVVLAGDWEVEGPAGDGGGTPYLGHGLRQPNFGTKFGASVRVVVPYGWGAGSFRDRPGGAARGGAGSGGGKEKAPALAGAFLAQALAWARAAAATGVSRGVSAVSGAFSWGAASRRSRATASISLMRFSWLTRVAPGS